jgi:hypothetical protein
MRALCYNRHSVGSAGPRLAEALGATASISRAQVVVERVRRAAWPRRPQAARCVAVVYIDKIYL